MGKTLIPSKEPVIVYGLEVKDRTAITLPLRECSTFQEARDEAYRRAELEGVPRHLFAIGTKNGIDFSHLSSMVRLVERYVTSYQEDFYWHDLYSMSASLRGIWGLRPTGTVFCPLSSIHERTADETLSSIEYAEYYLKQKEHRWFMWTPEKITRISVERAQKEMNHLKSSVS